MMTFLTTETLSEFGKLNTKINYGMYWNNGFAKL